MKKNTCQPFLQVENLVLHYRIAQGTLQAVDGVDFSLEKGRALVILGESGCGKTSLTRALLRLLPANTAACTGRVLLGGQELLSLPEPRFRREIRWKKIALVMQAAMNAFNPVMRVGDQVAEPLRLAQGWDRRRALARTGEVFRLVGLPEDFINRYPCEFSGGMRQRAALAMALAAEPELVILDEPTSALDVLTQGNIMNTLKDVKARLGTSFIMITHDVATSSQLADRVALMYAGRIVEEAAADRFFRQPAHPYARLLLDSVPRLRHYRKPTHIPGQPPGLLEPPAGCRFAARCPARTNRCRHRPPTAAAPGGGRVDCWLFASAPDPSAG